MAFPQGFWILILVSALLSSIGFKKYVWFLSIGYGLVLEAAADREKSAQKKLRPDMTATEGLYKMCRCPNYFGEIILWTGVFVSGIGVLEGWQWLVAGLGYVTIVYVMFSGAKRLEKRQNKNYGDKEEYRAYVEKTPILIPLIPLYHLVKEEK